MFAFANVREAMGIFVLYPIKIYSIKITLVGSVISFLG